MRHTFPVRVRLRGDYELTSRYVGEARVLLGELMHDLGESGIRSGIRQRRYKDAAIVVAFDGVLPTIDISQAALSSESSEQTTDVWVPRGFVVEPASNDAPIGWGLPATPGDDDDPLNPPAAPASWTVGGPLPQVLLTRVPEAGYPAKDALPLPMYFDPPEKREDISLPEESEIWSAYRVAFEFNGSDAQATTAAVNAARPSDAPVSAPFRGHADLARWYEKLTSKYGFVEAGYPLGSNTAAKRLSKDGTPFETAERTPVGAIGIVDLSSASSPAEAADLLIAAIPPLGNDTYFKGSAALALAGAGAASYVTVADYRSQWVKAGNLDWRSVHEEIPVISWTGPQGRSAPPRELAFGLRRYDYTNLGASMFIDETTTDFQGRTFRLFDRFVYARGRVLAMLPDDGYVLGAAVQKIPQTLAHGVLYRLVVVGWHRADQFFQSGDTGFVKVWDTTSDIRVWYADLPARNGLALLPTNVVEGAYDALTNPEGWRQIDRHRLWPLAGDTDQYGPGWYVPPEYDPSYGDEVSRCSTKTYWQPWFFNGSGTEAHCIRASVGLYGGMDALSFGGVEQPAQAIRLDVTGDIPASSIALAWSYDFESHFAFPPFMSGPVYYAWDYDGDDMKRAAFTADPLVGPFGAMYIDNTAGVHLAENVLAGVSSAEFDTWSPLFYDARTDHRILGKFRVSQDDEDYDNDHLLNVTLDINGATYSGVVEEPLHLSWTTVGNNGALPQAWCDRLEWARFTVDHPNFMLGLSVSGDDFVAGAWFGAVPGDMTGGAGDGTTTDHYTTVVAGVASSFAAASLYNVPNGWLNFAGVA